MTALLAEAARPCVARADEVEVTWVTPDAVEQSMPLRDAWSVPFQCGLPVRRFTARKGQRHLSGLFARDTNPAIVADSRHKLDEVLADVRSS